MWKGPSYVSCRSKISGPGGGSRGLASIWLTWIRLVRDSQEKETLELELAGVEVSGTKVLACCWGRVSASGCM